jgi:hypothetical protein
VVVHPAGQEQFDQIARDAEAGRQPAQAIRKGLRVAVARIKSDGQWGEVIPPSSIPSRFVREFGVTNLYCVDLPSFHRLFYTIRDRDVVLLGLVSHPE